MEVVTSSVFVCFLALLGIIFAIVSPAVEAQSPAAAPAPAPGPSSDGRFSSLRINLDPSFWIFHFLFLPSTDKLSLKWNDY